MDLAVIAIAFGAIFLVELPDKTFIAALVLSTRYKPLAVWVGVGLAFLVQTLIAVLAGQLATLLPDKLIKSVALAIFLIGGVLLFRSAPGADAEEKETEEEYAAKAVGLAHRPAGRRRLVPGAVRRRVGRPLPAADDQHDRAGTATRGASSSAPGPPCSPSRASPCWWAGCCCATCGSR